MYTVRLTRNRAVHHFPAATLDDLRVLKDAMVHRYGDLCVDVLVKSANEAPSQALPLVKSSRVTRKRLTSAANADHIVTSRKEAP